MTVSSSPWQPEFCNWAFNLPRGELLQAKWRSIPTDTDVLVTHTPPFGRGDRVGSTHVGCEALAREVVDRVRPQLHVFGHVHEGYGSSSNGTTVFVNASSCTHEYEAVNAPVVLTLTAPKAARADALSLDYARMLHEQLRVCSQKPLFVPTPQVSPYQALDSEAGTTPRRLSLRAFRVDGTTSGLLLESTLKLRPVVGEQTRALRYLFHNGFNDRADTAGDATASTQATGNDTEALARAAAVPQPMPLSAQRRSVQRRVTMAVLDHVSETREVAESAPLELTAPTVRVRRNKTLQRRDGLARLAPMPEEPDEKPQQVVGAATVLVENVDVVTVVVTPPPPPPPAAPVVVVECTLCKYKVPGHVHPGSASAASAVLLPPPVTPSATAAAVDVVVVECTLCKYKVPGHVHPGRTLSPATAGDSETAKAVDAAVERPGGDGAENHTSSGGDRHHEASGNESARQKAVGSSRLSSWF